MNEQFVVLVCPTPTPPRSNNVSNSSDPLVPGICPFLRIHGHISRYIHLFQLRLLPWTMFHSLQCTMVNPFVAGSLILFTFIEIMETLNFQESFQVQWLLKFLSMTELKISFLKSHSKKLEASSFNNIKWIGFYRLIKLRFCMGQNAGYFNKANQRYSFFIQFLKKCLKNR